MFAPDVEARFKKIEDNLIVASELLRRFEKKTDERLDRLEAVQTAMARWLDELNAKVDTIAEKVDAIADAHIRLEDAHIRLEATLERYLRSRTNGGTN